MENLDFLNLNSLRAFPLKEGVSRINTDGRITIPDDFLVDLILAAPMAITARVYVSEIINLPDQITVRVAEFGGSVIGTFVITAATHSFYKTYYMTASTAYYGAIGKLVVGSLAGMSALPTGSFIFTLETAEVEARTVIPTSGGVRSIKFVDANGNEAILSGDVKITARQNMRIAADGDNVFVDAANGLGLNQACENSSIDPIRTINNIPPDENGNFTITFTDCDSISEITNGLALTDACNKPCMGCTEIAELTQRLMTLEGDLLKLRTYFDDINATAAQLNNAVNFSCEIP